MAEFTTPAEVKAEIERITGAPVRTSGGRWGGKASVDYRGQTMEARDDRNVGFALTLLLNQVVDETPVFEDKKPRPTVEDALTQITALTGRTPDVLEADEDRTPGPVWKGKTLVSIVPCNGECMLSEKDICDCRCDGANHGIIFGLQGAAIVPTLYGDKQCLCGCGGITKRRFVPGHDARYHAAQKRAAKEAAEGATTAPERAIVAAVAPKTRKAAPVADPIDGLPF